MESATGTQKGEKLQPHLTAELVWLRLWGKDISDLTTENRITLKSARRENIILISFKQSWFSFMLLRKNEDTILREKFSSHNFYKPSI